MPSSCVPISPTHLAVQSLAFPLPQLPPAPNDGSCGLCGTPLHAGQTPAVEYQPPADFGAADHLHPQRNAHICAPCKVVTAGASGFTTRYSRVLFTTDAAYRLSAAEDIGWMLQQPQPPFVAVFNTRPAAHMLWQAPVTLDRECIGIVLGNVTATLRPAAVLAAREALGRLTEVANAALGAHYQWAVRNLSLYDDVVDLCRLIPSHDRVLRSHADAAVAADLARFDDLNLAERWALAALLMARPKRAQELGTFATPPILEHTP